MPEGVLLREQYWLLRKTRKSIEDQLKSIAGRVDELTAEAHQLSALSNRLVKELELLDGETISARMQEYETQHPGEKTSDVPKELR